MDHTATITLLAVSISHAEMEPTAQTLQHVDLHIIKMFVKIITSQFHLLIRTNNYATNLTHLKGVQEDRIVLINML